MYVNLVDRSSLATESDRSPPMPLSLQTFIVETGYASDGLQSVMLDRLDPCQEFVDHVARRSSQLPTSPFGDASPREPRSMVALVGLLINRRPSQ